MDNDRFDRFSRIVSSRVSRRTSARMLAALGLANLFAQPVGAKRKKKKKKKSRNPAGALPSPPNCLAAESSVGLGCGSCCSGYCYPYQNANMGPALCNYSRDGGACLTNNDCHSFTCINYQCVGPLKHPGDPCESGSECIGTCNGDPGVCALVDPPSFCDLDTDCRLGKCGIDYYQPRNGLVCLRMDVYDTCGADEDCTTFTCSNTNKCICPQYNSDYCEARGRKGCVLPSCNDKCGAPCNPQDDNPCGCDSTYLICDFVDGNQDGYYCLPP